jgi:hypothetical protein
VEEEGISADVVNVADVANATEVELLAEVSIVAIYRVQHPSLHYIVAVDCAHGVTILSHRGQ